MYLVTSGLVTYLPQSRIVISASLTFCQNNGDKLLPRTQQMANNTAYWWYVISGLFSKFELTAKSVSTSNQIYDLFSYPTMFFAYVNKGGSFGEIYMGVGPNLEKVLYLTSCLGY